MALSNLTRVRIILDLAKDGEVMNELAYNNSIDRLSGSATHRYISDFANEYGFVVYDENNEPVEPTDEQLAEHFLKILRVLVKGVHTSQEIKTEIQSVTASAIEAAHITTLSEIGE